MNLFADLKSAKAMYLKAILFLVSGVACAAGLIAQSPDLRTAFLILVMIWSFCRLYYFLFYVIERYTDPSFRFDGVFSAVRHLMKRKRKIGESGGGQPSSHYPSANRISFTD